MSLLLLLVLTITSIIQVESRALERIRKTSSMVASNAGNLSVSQSSDDQSGAARTVKAYRYVCSLRDQLNVTALTRNSDLDVVELSFEPLQLLVKPLNGNGERHLQRLGCRGVDQRQWNRLRRESPEHRHGRAKRATPALDSMEWYNRYYSYNDIMTFYSMLASMYNSIVTLTNSIGQSVEGRNIPAVKITAASGSQTPKVLVTCLLHAREWVSGSICMYIAYEMASRYQAGDQEITPLLNSLELHIVPIMNPDGYVYSWPPVDDRDWRKNKGQTNVNTCPDGEQPIGVDLNRNFNIDWGATADNRSSASGCASTYHGLSAASEEEVKHLVAYFRQNAPFVAFLDYHSWSQAVLRPWGYTNAMAPDDAFLKRMGDGISNAIYNKHNWRYVSETFYEMYPTSGAASDWFYSADANMGRLKRLAACIHSVYGGSVHDCQASSLLEYRWFSPQCCMTWLLLV